MASSQNGNIGIWSGYTPGDNGWTSQHNSNWDAIDALMQATIKSATTTTPPGSPANGDMYIVPSGATGAWVSQTNKLAVWVTRSSAWAFYSPKNGWQVFNQADGGDYLYNGTAWILQGSQRLNVSSDYISGLRLIWNSNTSISVSTGSAYIPSLGRLSLVNATLTLSSLSLSASTWYHIYLFENSGTPTIECVTTAPAAAYFGTAHAKTGDTSRRYVGSVKTDASGNINQFMIDTAGFFRHLISVGGVYRTLSNGKATTRTTVSQSAAMPITATHAMIQVVNSDTSFFVNLSNSFAVSSGITGVPPGGSTSSQTLTMPTDSSQGIDYAFAGSPTGGFYIDVVGFAFER